MVNFDYSYEDKLNLKFKPITRELMSYKDEVRNTAKRIYGSTSKPLYLGMSGGIDSEVIALTLIELNIPFTPVIFKFSDEYNSHDISWSFNFCENHKLQPLVIDVDIPNFLQHKIKEYSSQGYKAIRIFRYLQLLMMEKIESIGGCLILGSGEQVYCTVENIIHMGIDRGYMMSLDWCKNNNTIHYPYFFMENPEVYAAYMKIDVIEFLLQRPNYFTYFLDNLSVEKVLVLHSIWSMQRRKKFHGFEKMLHLKQETEKQLREKFPNIKTEFFPISRIKKELAIG